MRRVPPRRPVRVADPLAGLYGTEDIYGERNGTWNWLDEAMGRTSRVNLRRVRKR